MRFGNPTDNPALPKGGYYKVSYLIIKYHHHNKLIFTSSETDQNFNLDEDDEICFDPVSAQILRQSNPDLFAEFANQEKVNITVEIKTIINKKIPSIKTILIRI